MPKTQVLGEVGNGWELNQAWLGARRFQVGIRSHGMSQRVLRHVAEALRHDPKETEKFVATLGHFLAELAALRTLTYYGAWKADQKMDVRSEAANVKLFGTELIHKIVDFALEVAGPSVLRKAACRRQSFPTRAFSTDRRRTVGDPTPYYPAGSVSRRRRVARLI